MELLFEADDQVWRAFFDIYMMEDVALRRVPDDWRRVLYALLRKSLYPTTRISSARGVRLRCDGAGCEKLLLSRWCAARATIGSPTASSTHRWGGSAASGPPTPAWRRPSWCNSQRGSRVGVVAVVHRSRDHVPQKINIRSTGISPAWRAWCTGCPRKCGSSSH
jgi:hypothetical protein